MDLLDVVIRTHDPARLDELNRAVFSAALQDYRPLALHVVCQRFGPDTLLAVRDSLAPIVEVAGDVALHLHNRPDAAPADARAALLNLGVRHGTGRYLAFLDYDDLIYAEGWRLLIDELAASGAAIAFGAVLNATVCRGGVVPHVEAKHRVFQGDGLPQLLRNNFCPLHSYVLDRSRLTPGDVEVDESMVALEDYDLLMRIVTRYPSSFHLKDTVVGEYLLKDDGSNINPIASRPAIDGPPVETPWTAALAEVERRKAGLVLSPAVQLQLGVQEPGLTVAGFLGKHPP